MVARPQIPLLRHEALGTFSFEDTCTRHKMYFDLVPYIIGIRKDTPEFNEAFDASKLRCLEHFRSRLIVEADEDGSNRKIQFCHGIGEKVKASQIKARVKLIYEIYSSYKSRSTRPFGPGSADLTEEELADLEEFYLQPMTAAVLQAELFPHDAEERNAFLAFCELTRDLFYFKTLPDENVHPWTFSANGRRMGFRRENLKITKDFVCTVASSRIDVDPRWSAVKNTSGLLNVEKMVNLTKKYSPIAPILYSIDKMGWPDDIWANKFYLGFDRFATFYREMYEVLTSKHVFSHHNERSFTEENIYWLDLTSWEPTTAPHPTIEKELIAAIKLALT